MIRRKKIEAIADQILDRYQAGDLPVRVESIAKQLGLEVRRQKLEDSNLSAFLYREGNRSIIGVNASHAEVRQRFSIAHEIGHFLLHSESLHYDRSVQAQVFLRDAKASEGVYQQEIEANAFAACLLMPRQFVLGDLEGLDRDVDILSPEIERLARQRYKVSPQAFTHRLSALGFIEPW